MRAKLKRRRATAPAPDRFDAHRARRERTRAGGNPSAGADIATKSYVDAATAIKLDDLQLPDDNTDLDATTARHGLLPKLDGDIGHVLRGDGTFGAVPGAGAALGTTLAVYADDAPIGSTDDVIEVYLGKRVTLPAYDSGKRDRIVIINTGNTASLIKACQTPSVARGVALADDGAAGTSSQRFVLSGHASNAFFAKAMTFAAWVRAASDGAKSVSVFDHRRLEIFPHHHDRHLLGSE